MVDYFLKNILYSNDETSFPPNFFNKTTSVAVNYTRRQTSLPH